MHGVTGGGGGGGGVFLCIEDQCVSVKVASERTSGMQCTILVAINID